MGVANGLVGLKWGSSVPPPRPPRANPTARRSGQS
jgi:hypothetical protein